MINGVKRTKISTKKGEDGQDLVLVEVYIAPERSKAAPGIPNKRFLFGFWAATDAEVEARINEAKAKEVPVRFRTDLVDADLAFRDLHLERIYEVFIFYKGSADHRREWLQAHSDEPVRGSGAGNRMGGHDPFHGCGYLGEYDCDEHTYWSSGRYNYRERAQGPVCPQARTGG